MSKSAQRKAMRSGNSSCPICDTVTRLCRHHLNGREIRGAEESWNTAWICPTCHDKIHGGDIIIEGWFSTSDGMELIWRKRGEDPITGMETKPPSY